MYATSPSSCSFRALFVLFSPSLHTREKGKVLRRYHAGASEKCHSGIQSAKSTLRSGGYARARNKEKGRSALLACLASSLFRILNPPPSPPPGLTIHTSVAGVPSCCRLALLEKFLTRLLYFCSFIFLLLTPLLHD